MGIMNWLMGTPAYWITDGGQQAGSPVDIKDGIVYHDVVGLHGAMYLSGADGAGRRRLKMKMSGQFVIDQCAPSAFSFEEFRRFFKPGLTKETAPAFIMNYYSKFRMPLWVQDELKTELMGLTKPMVEAVKSRNLEAYKKSANAFNVALSEFKNSYERRLIKCLGTEMNVPVEPVEAPAKPVDAFQPDPSSLPPMTPDSSLAKRNRRAVD